MKLSEALPLLKSGDVLLVSGTAPHSWLIRLWTLSKYSHAALVVWGGFAGEREACVFESLEGAGVRLVPLAEYLAGNRVDWFAIADRTIDRKAVVRYCRSVWGRRYSPAWQLVWSFGRLSRWLARRLGLRAELDPSRPFCSWVVLAALKAGGYVPPPDLADAQEPCLTAPAAIAGLTCLRPMGPLHL